MTAQLTKKGNGFTVAIADDERGGGYRYEVTVRGDGDTKHDAIGAALVAIKQARAALDRAEKEVHNL